MSKQINIEELKALIANGIRQENLHEALPEDAVERIKNKILDFKKREAAKEIPGVVSELDTPAFQNVGDDAVFPDESQVVASPEQPVNMTGDTTSFFVDSGSEATEAISNPTMGYTPELPEILKKAEPSELFVFRYNDIGESGENLSYKPLRLMDDPDVKKSMNDLWIEQGKTKAKIYVAKFEEIGEVEFNYGNGTSSFTEKGSAPENIGGPSYKENPYAPASTPQIDEPTKSELETYIKTSIDLEKVVSDMVMNILKDSLLTNTEKAVNQNFQEDIDPVADRPENATETVQMMKPMEESIEHGDEEIELNITMLEIVENNSFEKIELPKELSEKINLGDKTLLIRENKEVQEWEYNNKKYYTPIERISKTRGYIKS